MAEHSPQILASEEKATTKYGVSITPMPASHFVEFQPYFLFSTTSTYVLVFRFSVLPLGGALRAHLRVVGML